MATEEGTEQELMEAGGFDTLKRLNELEQFYAQVRRHIVPGDIRDTLPEVLGWLLTESYVNKKREDRWVALEKFLRGHHKGAKGILTLLENAKANSKAKETPLLAMNITATVIHEMFQLMGAQCAICWSCLCTIHPSAPHIEARTCPSCKLPPWVAAKTDDEDEPCDCGGDLCPDKED